MEEKRELHELPRMGERSSQRDDPTIQMGSVGPVTVRLGPHKSVLVRLKFFLRARLERKIGVANCGGGLAQHNA